MAEELRQLREVECSISSVEKQLDTYAAEKPQVKRLRSAPGIGRRLSEAVVAIIDDPHRFKKGWQVAAYAGLVPRVFQSGKMDRKGRITGAGNRYLRSILVEVSWLGFGFGNTAKRCSIDMTEARVSLGALSSTERMGNVTCNS